MNPNMGDLLNQLDPRAVRALKRRLASGQITPRMFKDILRRQMVRTYFEAHPHAVRESWFSRRPSPPKPVVHNPPARKPDTSREAIHHKHF